MRHIWNKNQTLGYHSTPPSIATQMISEQRVEITAQVSAGYNIANSNAYFCQESVVPDYFTQTDPTPESINTNMHTSLPLSYALNNRLYKSKAEASAVLKHVEDKSAAGTTSTLLDETNEVASRRVSDYHRGSDEVKSRLCKNLGVESKPTTTVMPAMPGNTYKNTKVDTKPTKVDTKVETKPTIKASNNLINNK